MKVCMSGRIAGLLAALSLVALAADAAALERATAPSGLSSAGSGAQQLAGERARFTRQTRKNNKKANKQLEVECLAAHNKFRRMHKVPDLQWDDKLAAFAQKRSNHIAKSDGAAFGHPPDLPYGENLFWHSSVATPCDLMVRGWYDEIKLYNFNNPTFAPETGHFTQVIWRTTQRVGCAVAQSSGKRGGLYLTCSYDPAGNFLGEFVENVPRIVTSAQPPLKPDVNKLPATVPSGATLATPGTTRAPNVEASTATSTSTSTSTTTMTTTVASTSTSKPSSGDNTTKPKSKKKKNKKKKNKKKKNKKKKANASTTTAPVSTTSAQPTRPQRARRSSPGVQTLNHHLGLGILAT